MEALKEYLNNNFVITNKEAEQLGYGRHILANMARQGTLERVKPGLYQLNGELTDDFMLISSNSERVVFSHQTALYLHDLSDRSPNIFHISVPQAYNASHIKKRYDNLKIHYIKKDLFSLGLIDKKTPMGNEVQVYDMERTICDVIIDKKNIDKQIFTDAIRRYFKSSKKDLRKLIKYSKKFGIEEEVRNYIEVLSWQILKA